VGDGPTNSVFQGALDIRLEAKNRWLPFLGDAYRSLNFSHPSGMVPKTGKLDLKVDGSLTALVMIQLLLEPYPVNPFLVYAAFFKKPECLDFLLRPYKDYKPEHLLAMIPDRETWELVAALIVHRPEQPYTETEVVNDPLLIRFVTLPEKPVPISTFKGPREPEQHSTMIRRLLSELLIGHGSAWEQDQFQAFASGLRLGICNVDDIVKVCEGIPLGSLTYSAHYSPEATRRPKTTYICTPSNLWPHYGTTGSSRIPMCLIVSLFPACIS
jgi:hypothetical protein